MKAIMVAKAHFDTILPLVKELSEEMNLELVFLVAGEHHKESVFDFDLKGCPAGIIKDDPTVLSLLGGSAQALEHTNLTVTFFKLPSWKFLSLRNQYHALRLSAYLRRSKADVIHFVGVLGLFHTLFYWFTRNIPKVQTLHDSSDHSGEENIRQEINRVMLTKQNSILVVPSRFTARQLEERYRLKVKSLEVVPFGPLQNNQSGEGRREVNPHQILFWGRISPYKGIEYLVEAFEMVQKTHPRARLVIAGSGRINMDEGRLRDNPGIGFENRYIPQDELAGLIARSAVVAVPYTDATQSGVIMTAYAHGTPVVGTEVGGIPEMIRDGKTGFLVPPRDSGALAQALVRILDDQALQQSMSQAVHELCETEYSWKAIAGRTMDIYRKAEKA